MTTTMTKRSCAAAAFAGLLLIAPIPEASASAGRGLRSTTTGTNKPVSGRDTVTRDHRDRVIRDHRGEVRTRRSRKAEPICAGWAC